MILKRIKLSLLIAAGSLFIAASLIFLTSFFLLLIPFMVASAFFLPANDIEAMDKAKPIEKVSNLFDEKWKRDHDDLYNSDENVE